MNPRIVFFAPPTLTGLDLIGPFQVFQMAERLGHPYRIEVCALTKSVPIGGNLVFSNLRPYQDIRLEPEDTLFVAGYQGDHIITPAFRREHATLFEWLRQCRQSGATICSVCTGAFFLAEAGILDGLACTTHWADTKALQELYPLTRVKHGVVFVEEDRLLTSAGVASGIDLAIHLIGKRHGSRLAFEIAHRLVVYVRRTAAFEQESIYLQFRNHQDDLVHRTQNVLIEHLDHPPKLEVLARVVGASPRTLSRRFRKSLSLSVGEYLIRLRLERARSLLNDGNLKVEDVARACGYADGRQLRNLYRRQIGQSPGQTRRNPSI
ncbi:MAG: helix-turn-helix domain-containing protein [Opitutaceae bacterium]